MLETSYIAAAIAGFVTFFTPCVLPMVPFYLSYMAGLSMQELRSGEIPQGAKRRLFLCAITFSLGVLVIFTLYGLAFTALGRQFATYRDYFAYIAAAILFIFGLHFLGIFRIPFLYREAKIDSSAVAATVPGSFVIGLAFGFGWSACASPILSAILFTAMQQDSFARGVGLLVTYGIFMVLPFVIAALFTGPFLSWSSRNRHLLAYSEKVAGIMLIIFAILMATGNINRLAQWMLETFPSFQSMG